VSDAILLLKSFLILQPTIRSTQVENANYQALTAPFFVYLQPGVSEVISIRMSYRYQRLNSLYIFCLHLRQR